MTRTLRPSRQLSPRLGKLGRPLPEEKKKGVLLVKGDLRRLLKGVIPISLTTTISSMILNRRPLLIRVRLPMSVRARVLSCVRRSRLRHNWRHISRRWLGPSPLHALLLLLPSRLQRQSSASCPGRDLLPGRWRSCRIRMIRTYTLPPLNVRLAPPLRLPRRPHLLPTLRPLLPLLALLIPLNAWA